MLAAIIAIAVLFALYGYVRSRDECTHECGTCSKGCGAPEAQRHE